MPLFSDFPTAALFPGFSFFACISLSPALPHMLAGVSSEAHSLRAGVAGCRRAGVSHLPAIEVGFNPGFNCTVSVSAPGSTLFLCSYLRIKKSGSVAFPLLNKYSVRGSSFFSHRPPPRILFDRFGVVLVFEDKRKNDPYDKRIGREQKPCR